MTPAETTRLNAQQEALEREEQKLTTELFHVRRSLEHLKRCRFELTTGKTPVAKKGNE
jgi:hypothetical protein